MERKKDLCRMRIVFLFLCLSLVSSAGFSQNLEQYNWYFSSSNQAIRFNRTSAKPSIVTKAIPFGAGGSATASDPANANLLFYTDGQFVYDASNAQMPGGFGLNANPSGNQPVVICPVPGPANAKKYFVFTNSANFPAGGAISVSVVDMNLVGNSGFQAPALGDLESKNTAIPGLVNRAEGMIVIPHSNGTDFWLVTQQVNSLVYSVTAITAASYTGTFTTTNTSGLSAIPISAANFSYHAGKKKLAVSPQDTSTDAVILDFDPATGGLSFDRYILNSGLPTTTNQSIYDIEWSLKGDYLYLSRYGEPGVQADLLQYDYLNPLTTLTSVLPAPVFRSYGVQITPDSTIYHLYQNIAGGPILLGEIGKPDTIASQVKYKTAQLTATSFAGTQFSSFAAKANPNPVVNFTFIGTCQDNPTTFFPDVQPVADSLNWDFGDMSGSSAWSPVHKFSQAQTFNVKLTAFYQGKPQSTTLPVTIQTFALKLNLVQDTTACRPEFPPPRGKSSPKQFSVTAKVQGGTPTSYVWSNGDTGPVLTPDSAGYYYVVVTDASGCATYGGVNVKEYGLQDQRQNIWFFGNHAGIDFNKRPPVPLSNSAMDAPEGCAIVCDRDGNTIFYTDGDNVYNKHDVLITNAIGGSTSSSQSSIIVPVPGDETLYYIFTTQDITSGTNEVRYSLFDLKKNNGDGDVVIKDQLLFAKATERVTASGKWLVIHEAGNNTFRVYPITSAGIGAAILTAIGSDHNPNVLANGEGYMKLGPLNNLAVALSTPGVSNLIELFHLNDTTGKLTNYRKIDLKEPAGQVYGIEFSPGGKKLFATVKGNPTPSEVFEYFIDSIGHVYFKQRIDKPTLELGAIQIGPDGQLYMAINGSNVLATIQATDDTTRVSPINFGGFNLAAGTTSRLGLPNFIQQINNATGGPGIDVAGVCLGSPTKFVGTATDAIDNFFWFFGDGGSDTQASPQHTYAAAGTYNVSMRLTNRCGLDTTLVAPTKIFAPPGRPTVPGAAALCNGPVTLDANTGNLPGLTYLWSSKETTQTIVIKQQSIVNVTVTDTNGCHSSATTLVADNQPKVDIGPDQTLCQNSFTSALNAQNPGANYSWTVNGGGTTTAQSRQLDTTVPGVFQYQVVVTDPITTCSVTDQATFTVIASPLFALSGIDPTGCGTANGTLTLQLNTTTPPTGPYSYFMTGPGGFNSQAVDQTAPQTINFPGLAAGTYSGVVNDQISGCTISQSFGLNDAPFTANAAVLAPNCDPVTIQVTTNAVALPLLYTVTPSGPGTTIPSTSAATATFNTTPVTAGTYTIQVKDNGGCIFNINNFAVTPNAPVSVTLTPNVCATPPTITASGANSYVWTGPGIVSGANNATVTVSGQGTFTYSVVASAAGSCDNTDTITVDLDNSTTDFTQSDPCQNNVILTATPVGNYTYRWYKGGVFQPGLLGRQISLGLSENGASYQAEAVNAANGCAKKSPAKTVSVTGFIDAGLSSTLACDDNKAFTLTAVTTATGVTYAWFKDNAVISGATTASINQTDAATYKVEISKATCKTSTSIQIIKAPLPVGSLPNREVICNDPENKDPMTNNVDLDPGQFAKYDWFKNELNIGYTARVYNATSQGKYKVDLTNTFGCVASDEVEVRNECIPKIEVPNAFRPSSTIAENKEFYIFSFFITDNFQIFLYNRWGELVYTSSDRYFKWNGGLNNSLSQPLPGGSYAYVIKYVSAFHPERGVLEKRGGVALLR
jgi:PKD repeat protein